MPFLAPIGFALGVGTAATATAAATGVLAASIVGGAVVAGTGLGIASMAGAFGGGNMPTLPGMPSIGTPATPASEADVNAAETKKLRKGATKSTILTGPLGLLSPAETKFKTLLGE